MASVRPRRSTWAPRPPSGAGAPWHEVPSITASCTLRSRSDCVSSETLNAFDLDADGYRDILVGKFWGATGNRGYDAWRFDPSTRRFVADTALSAMWNPNPIAGRRCVSTSNTSARDDGMGVHCLHDGQWRLNSIETNTWNRDSNSVTHEVIVRRGDSLVLVKRETRPDST